MHAFCCCEWAICAVGWCSIHTKHAAVLGTAKNGLSTPRQLSTAAALAPEWMLAAFADLQFWSLAMCWVWCHRTRPLQNTPQTHSEHNPVSLWIPARQSSSGLEGLQANRMQRAASLQQCGKRRRWNQSNTRALWRNKQDSPYALPGDLYICARIEVDCTTSRTSRGLCATWPWTECSNHLFSAIFEPCRDVLAAIGHLRRIPSDLRSKDPLSRVGQSWVNRWIRWLCLKESLVRLCHFFQMVPTLARPLFTNEWPQEENHLRICF